MTVLIERPLYTLVQVKNAAFPAWLRLVWRTHVEEFSHLSREHQWQCLRALEAMERALIHVVAPDKINLASLGNQAPHLHWHVMARFLWDSHFPDAVWAPARREVDRAKVQSTSLAMQGITVALQHFLALP